jgi:hypothetical protein
MAKKKIVDHLEVLAQAKVAGSHWSLVTNSRLETVLKPDYWAARFADYPLRVHDRVEVTANLNGDAEYASLVIAEVTNRRVTRIKLMSEVSA